MVVGAAALASRLLLPVGAAVVLASRLLLPVGAAVVVEAPRSRRSRQS